MDYSKIRGFNYQPSRGTTGFEIWRNFDADLMGHELSLGKLYFPGMNAIRLWLSYDVWVRNPAEYGRVFDRALSIAEARSLPVMPVLFNRWHSDTLDYGGIYVDHFLAKSGWADQMMKKYAEAIFSAHAADPRVFAWDLCNEPFLFGCPLNEIPEIVKAEYAWLERTYGIAKRCGVRAPITVGINPVPGQLALVEPISDLLSVHPYWTCDSPVQSKEAFEKDLDGYVQFAAAAGKPLLATETCWGATDDAKRVEIIRYTLGQLKKRNIGWLAYLLHHSPIGDSHRAEFGAVGVPGNLAFIEADGALRPGHEVFNEF